MAGRVYVAVVGPGAASAEEESAAEEVGRRLGEARNALVVASADVVVAVGGAYGTLSEIALALKAGTPVVGLRTWAIDGVQSVASAHEAVRLALSLAGDGAARNLSEGVERPPSGDVPFD